MTLKFNGVTALHKVTFSLTKGEIIGVLGPNGAGKSSLASCITGFIKPDEGQILFNGDDLCKYPPEKITRSGLARTYQIPQGCASETVLTNLLIGRHIHSHYRLYQALFFTRAVLREEARQVRTAEELLDFLELQDCRETPLGDLPFHLQKRAELARALALEPVLLILDEPFSGVHMREADFMARIIRDLNEIWGQTILLVEHDLIRAGEVAHRVVVMDFGVKIAEGPPEFIQNHPRVLEAYFGAGGSPLSEPPLQ